LIIGYTINIEKQKSKGMEEIIPKFINVLLFMEGSSPLT